MPDGNLQFQCATNSGLLCTYKLKYDNAWSISMVQKVEGFGQLFGVERSALGTVAKSYDGRIYIDSNIFDFKTRYRTCQLGVV